MYTGTTPTHSFKLPFDTSTLKAIQVIYKQGGMKMTKLYKNNKLPSGMSIDGAYVYVRLTEMETNAFSPDSLALCQIRVRTEEDNVIPSKIKQIKVYDSLDTEVLI